MTVRFAFAFFAFAAAAACAAEPALTVLPLPFETRNGPVDWTAIAPDALTIAARPGANWFVSPSDFRVIDSAPTLLFKPAGDFSLQARIALTPVKQWDLGCLALVIDKDYWAKLCLENAAGDGKLAAVSVVNRKDSDDVYTDFFAPDNTMYLKVSRQATALHLSASHDGQDWRMFRTFTFKSGDLAHLKAGLLAQSPVGGGMTVRFSDIKYSPGRRSR